MTKIEKLTSKSLNDSPFTKTTLFDDKNMLVFELTLKNGDEIPPSEHEGSSLLLYITKGIGKVNIADKETEVQEGNLIYLSKDEIAKIKSDFPQGLSCFVVISPRPPIKEQYNELGM